MRRAQLSSLKKIYKKILVQPLTKNRLRTMLRKSKHLLKQWLIMLPHHNLPKTMGLVKIDYWLSSNRIRLQSKVKQSKSWLYPISKNLINFIIKLQTMTKTNILPLLITLRSLRM